MAFIEIIEDATILTNLITLTAESLGACPAPLPVLHAGKPQKPFPIAIKPGKTLTVYYDVTFDCANYATKNTPDFRFSAIVNRTAIDDKDDTNPADNAWVVRDPATCQKIKAAAPENLIIPWEEKSLTDVVIK